MRGITHLVRRVTVCSQRESLRVPAWARDIGDTTEAEDSGSSCVENFPAETVFGGTGKRFGSNLAAQRHRLPERIEKDFAIGAVTEMHPNLIAGIAWQVLFHIR
jgi:hypothetical protein